MSSSLKREILLYSLPVNINSSVPYLQLQTTFAWFSLAGCSAHHPQFKYSLRHTRLHLWNFEDAQNTKYIFRKNIFKKVIIEQTEMGNIIWVRERNYTLLSKTYCSSVLVPELEKVQKEISSCSFFTKKRTLIIRKTTSTPSFCWWEYKIMYSTWKDLRIQFLYPVRLLTCCSFLECCSWTSSCFVLREKKICLNNSLIRSSVHEPNLDYKVHEKLKAFIKKAP